MARAPERVAGRSAAGSVREQGSFHIRSRGKADEPSLLILDATDGTTVTSYYLWVDNTGDLRISSTKPTDEDSDGTVVGAQTT